MIGALRTSDEEVGKGQFRHFIYRRLGEIHPEVSADISRITGLPGGLRFRYRQLQQVSASACFKHAGEFRIFLKIGKQVVLQRIQSKLLDVWTPQSKLVKQRDGFRCTLHGEKQKSGDQNQSFNNLGDKIPEFIIEEPEFDEILSLVVPSHLGGKERVPHGVMHNAVIT